MIDSSARFAKGFRMKLIPLFVAIFSFADEFPGAPTLNL